MPILKLAPKEVTDALRHHDDQDWLDAHPPGAPYTPPPPPEPEPYNWWPVVAVGVAAFFVLVLVLMY
ncbi:hypothetical protein [Yaravirus sp. 'brasiliensis']|uniref:Uncharacterized protein n=1 Tax=Yaravirus sp. 'brasiliensis' TaxID=2739681 RepID=A0AAE7B7U1_9VIRU|nr:hypothetical protein QKS73_gp14 [Yaravirus brasiliensis]QKE44387.1 hypothetical protein [Yaravirus brasiliensis]